MTICNMCQDLRYSKIIRFARSSDVENKGRKGRVYEKRKFK